jgi:environmental stress-induced protein Ves
MTSILRAENYRAMPWKNGGGTTREIALEADPSHPDRPLWRLSMATIERNGPFSDFAGYDRTIVAVDGNGVELIVANGAATTLDRSCRSASFPGEAHVQCRLVDGTVRDLNVMTRRDRFVHAIALRSAREGAALRCGEARFAVILEGGAILDGEFAAALDTIVLPRPGRAVTAGPGGVQACFVSLYDA